MQRTKSIVFSIAEKSFAASLSNIEEHENVTVNGVSYSPLPNIANCYEIVRMRQASMPVGIELQLGSTAYDIHLEKLSAFKRSHISDMEGAWLFLFREPESELYIEWEQILSNNPFFSSKGSALLIVSLEHLTETEYSVFENLANNSAIEKPIHGIDNS